MSSTITVRESSRGQEPTGDELEAWRGLIRTHSWVVKQVAAALEGVHGLPLRAYELLQQLAEQGSGRMRMCELAERVALSRSGLTRLVDRLEREGLVERCSCLHDGRGAYACITAGGRERLEEARATHLAVVRESFLSRCTARDLVALTALWSRLVPPAER